MLVQPEEIVRPINRVTITGTQVNCAPAVPAAGPEARGSLQERVGHAPKSRKEKVVHAAI